MKRSIIAATFSVAALGLLLGFAGAAAADSTGPITFEAPTYTIGTINGQNGWSQTGAYDVAVANVSDFAAAAGYGFGSQALRISDAVTTGAFGDQTFTPALTQPAGEALPQTHFEASFMLGSATGAEQAGMHMSVSPDNGSGGRMSYLRFEDHANGIHVFFDDATDAGPFYTLASFSDTDIATLGYGASHSIAFSIDFMPGPANDVVKITIDGMLKATGTSWEDYYRYDNENQGPGAVPTTSNLLFREAGTAGGGNVGKGYLVDGVSLASSIPVPLCTPTGLFRDGINLTAKQIGGTATGDINATGCNIGVYYAPGTTGTVNAANIHGANYYGVVVNAAAVNVTNSSIHNIGEVPFNGTQHGVGVLYTTINQALGTTGPAATGTLSGNTITLYQKNGVVVSGTGAVVTVQNNTVTGNGPVDYIAQNGIQMSYGATGTINGNTVSNNEYTGANGASSGGIIVVGGAFYFGLPYSTGISVTKNVVTNNDVGVWLSNADALGNPPVTKTNNKVVNNTISKTDGLTNVSGFDGTCGYQAGIADEGNKDNIVNNTISGSGYVPGSTCALTGTFSTAIDPLGNNHINNNHS